MFDTRRDPLSELFGEVGRLNREFNWLFGEGTREFVRGPGVNLWEDEHNLYAETDLPGVSEDKLEVTVKEGNQLSIQAERTAPEFAGAVWHRQERPFGTLNRSITLPVMVDADKVEATLENGVLRITLPKSEAVKPRKIVVKSNG